MFKNKNISFKISVLISLVFFIIFSGLGIYINISINKFTDQETLSNAKKLSKYFNKTLKDFMVFGDAEIVHSWLENEKNIIGNSIRVYRKDGKVAFQDNETVDLVNKFIGVEKFERKAKPKEEYVVKHKEDFEKILKDRKTIYYKVTENNQEFFVYLEPIIRDDRCIACHGYEEDEIRGISEVKIALDHLKPDDLKQLHKDNIVIFILFLIGGFFVLTWLIKKNLDKPINDLKEAAKKFGSGELKGEIEGDFDNEFHPVIQEFNNMSEKLSALYENLEERVRERTESLNKLNEEFLRREKMMDEDLEKASVVQMSFLPPPEQLYKKIQFYSFYIPSQNLSGDCYDIFKLHNGKYAFYIGDVSGHGISAAMVTILVNEIINKKISDFNEKYQGDEDKVAEEYKICLNPGKLLEYINNELTKKLGNSHYATLFYGLIDENNYSLLYAGAAHPPIFALKNDGKEIIELPSSGTVLGMFDNEKYKESQISLGVNDKLLLYTDGIYEVEGESDGKHLSKEYFKNAFKEKCKENSGFKLVTDLYQILISYSHTGEFKDDTAFMLLELNHID
ncbi:MAG: SpoIIE family protein phosphatase [Nitrospinae bacterium]|nr:SpoIIE family protein phosphatase [Nitrospinota bacterium]